MDVHPLVMSPIVVSESAVSDCPEATGILQAESVLLLIIR